MLIILPSLGFSSCIYRVSIMPSVSILPVSYFFNSMSNLNFTLQCYHFSFCWCTCILISQIILLVNYSYKISHNLNTGRPGVNTESVSQSCQTLCNTMDCCSLVSSVPGTLQAKVGSHSLLQGIFLTQGSNPDLLHCRQILYHMNHQGNPSQHCYMLYCLYIK